MTHKRKLSFLLLLVFIIGSIASLPLTASAAVADTDGASANTFKVTMNSNLFGTNVKTYDASTKHITVVYEINMAKYAIVNADLELSYDKNVFTYNTTENKDSEICPVAGSLLVVTTPATPVYGEEGLVKGNFGDVNNRIKAYGKDGKPAVFFKVVLDVNDGAAADTTITFNLKTFRICEETKLPENDSISVAKKSQILISDEEVAKFNAKEYSEATTLPGDGEPGKFTVKVTSNLFGEDVKTYDTSETKHIAVVYELNYPGYAIYNSEFELTYDPKVLTFNKEANTTASICPAAASYVQLTTPADTTFGTEGSVSGLFSEVNNRVKAYGANNKPATFLKVVFDVAEGAQGVTVVDLDVKRMKLCDETKIDQEFTAVKYSKVELSDSELAKLNVNDFSEKVTLPGDGEPGKFTVKVVSNLFGEDIKTYEVSDTKNIAVVYELNYPGYAIYNADFELTYDPNVLTFNKKENTTATICPIAASYVQLTTPADTTFGTEGIVSGLFSEVNNRVKAYGANNKPATFLKVIFDVADTAQGVTVVNLDVKRMKLCDETKIDQEFTAVKDSKVELSDTELAKLNVNDYSMKVDLSAHVHTVVIDKAVAATCTKTGLTEGSHCSVCNEVIKKQEVVPALGHQVVVDKAVAATCTKTGLTEGSHCSRCNEVIKKQEVVPKTKHTVVVDKAVAATCTKTGLTEGSHCSVCNTVIKKQEVVPALGHQVVIDKAVAATCTKTGLTEGSHCSRCNTVIKKQEVVKALGHKVVIDKAVAPTCTEVGYTEGSHCSRCGEVIKKQEVIPSKGHTPVIDEAVDATCQHTGLTTGLHCSTCGAVLIKQEVIPKLRHKIVYDKGKTATCTETGLTEGSHCSLCNEVFREQTVISALGHNYQVVKGYPATKTETGLTDGIKCSRCGEWLKKQEVIPKLGTEVLIGDVNMDGVVNGADAGILARHTSGWKNYDRLIKNWEAADVNRDGKVNGADAGILARYTSGWTDYNKYIKTIVL